MIARAIDWLGTHLPTRESIAGNRWLAPFADRLGHPALWRFNRRSVPRGVALGLASAFAVPFAHTVIAAGLAVPLRANVVVAASATWVSNPLTWVLIFPAEHAVGKWLIDQIGGGHALVSAAQAGVAAQGWLGWVVEATGEMLLGSLVLAAVAAILGYTIMAAIWRLRIARKWRRRAYG